MNKYVIHKTRLKTVKILLPFFLLLITTLIYWRIRDHQFFIIDDAAYISENQNVSNGFSCENVKWAFSSFYACNWHPVTWLSHMLDTELFGTDPKFHHLGNLLFHLFNILLVFFIFHKMTDAFWQSLFVAALFALHPLQVESIAWTAERKNTLSTFFWMLSICSYIRFSEKKTTGRYLILIFMFSLGVMSKAMVVTLPFVLLLLDIWPLNRFQNETPVDYGKIPPKKYNNAFYLIFEKIPLFIISGLSCYITIMAQQKWNALRTLDSIPLDIRIANAIISYKDYIIKMFWPLNLGFLYPHPGSDISFLEALLSGITIMFITTLIIGFSSRHRFLLVGWLWYLGTLIPVIGLVQVGSQQMADRYTYIPLIGLFIILSWGIPTFVPLLRHREKYFSILAISILLILSMFTYKQVGYWRDSKSVFTHTLNVTSNNYLAHYNLGILSSAKADVEGALYHFRTALEIKPDFADAHYNLGNALMRKGMVEEAIFHYSMAIRINPNDEMAHNNLGIAFARDNDLEQAIQHFSKALLLNPSFKEAEKNLAIALNNKKAIKIINLISTKLNK